MEIKYQWHQKRRETALETWRKMARDYNGDSANGIKGMAAEKVAKRYTNPKTGKPYTRCHVYVVLRKLKEIDEQKT